MSLLALYGTASFVQIPSQNVGACRSLNPKAWRPRTFNPELAPHPHGAVASGSVLSLLSFCAVKNTALEDAWLQEFGAERLVLGL